MLVTIKQTQTPKKQKQKIHRETMRKKILALYGSDVSVKEVRLKPTLVRTQTNVVLDFEALEKTLLTTPTRVPNRENYPYILPLKSSKLVSGNCATLEAISRIKIDFLHPKVVSYSLPQKRKQTTLQESDMNNEADWADVKTLPSVDDTLMTKLHLAYARFRSSSHTARRSLLVFTCLVALVLLPVKSFVFVAGLAKTQEKIMSQSTEALKHFELAQESLSLLRAQEANEEFLRAFTEIKEAEQTLKKFNPLVVSTLSIFPKKREQYKNGRAAIRVGKELATSGRLLSQTLALWQKNTTSLTERMVSAAPSLKSALFHIESAQKHLAEISPSSIPEENMHIWTELTKGVPVLSKNIEHLIFANSVGIELLGHKTLKRYLFIFQNTSELRASGGFLGSFALIDIGNGEIKNVEIPGGGFYDLQGQFQTLLAPPKPLTLLNNRWQCHDMNWSPDFPTSARKVAWCYEQATGREVDGVVSLNASIMPHLLKIFGPVDLPKHDTYLTPENFLFETQDAVEFEYDREENKPKQIIADTASVLLERVLTASSETWFSFAELTTKLLQEREIQMYSFHSDIQEALETLNWSGSVKETHEDEHYLMVVHSNIGGKKADAFTSDKLISRLDIKNTSRKDQRGETLVETILTRKHTGTPLDPLYGHPNIDYVRFYVPLGAELILSDGFDTVDSQRLEEVSQDALVSPDIASTWKNSNEKTVANFEELGKTVFAGWMITEPQREKTVKLQYRLPSHIPKQYIFQRQSGMKLDTFILEVSLPRDVSLALTTEDGSSLVPILEDKKKVFHYELKEPTSSIQLQFTSR